MSTTRTNAKATPINDNDYSRQTQVQLLLTTVTVN